MSGELNDHSTVERLRERVAARPADPVARARLAASLVGSSESAAAIDEAVALIESSLSLRATEPARSAAHILARAYDAPRFVVLEAEAALIAGDLEAGTQLLRGVVAQHPDFPPARVHLAALAVGGGRGEEALGWIEPVASAGLQAGVAYLQTLIALNRIDEARAFSAEAAERFPASSDVYLLMGLAALAAERPADAIDAFSEALRLAPNRPEVHYNLGVAFALDGALPAAIGVVDAGLAQRPEHPRLIALKADLQARFAQQSTSKE